MEARMVMKAVIAKALRISLEELFHVIIEKEAWGKMGSNYLDRLRNPAGSG